MVGSCPSTGLWRCVRRQRSSRWLFGNILSPLAPLLRRRYQSRTDRNRGGISRTKIGRNWFSLLRAAIRRTYPQSKDLCIQMMTNARQSSREKALALRASPLSNRSRRVVFSILRIKFQSFSFSFLSFFFFFEKLNVQILQILAKKKRYLSRDPFLIEAHSNWWKTAAKVPLAPNRYWRNKWKTNFNGN